MKTFVLIGKPVAHSASPALFRRWFSEYGIEADYEAMEIFPGQIDSIFGKIKNGKIAGANVTIPYKEMAAKACARLDEAAKRTGAVNTLLADGAGRVAGKNTDAPSFLASLEAGAPDWPKQAPACVLGSGGAARAVLHALDGAGVAEIRIIARRRPAGEAAARVCRRAETRLFEWSETDAAIGGAGLVVNATPLGMAGFAALDIPVPKAAPGAVALDLVYNAPGGMFLARCKAGGYATLTGTGMLLHQAALAFRAWFGETPPVTPELMRWLERTALHGEQ